MKWGPEIKQACMFIEQWWGQTPGAPLLRFTLPSAPPALPEHDLGITVVQPSSHCGALSHTHFSGNIMLLLVAQRHPQVAGRRLWGPIPLLPSHVASGAVFGRGEL